MTEEKKREFLATAIKNKDYNTVKQLLSEGVSPNKIVFRDLPLNMAIENKDIEMVKILIENGVDSNPKINVFMYPLAVSVKRVIKSRKLDENDPDATILQLLLKSGAKAVKLVPEYSEMNLSVVKGLGTLLRRYGWYDVMERVSRGGPP